MRHQSKSVRVRCALASLVLAWLSLCANAFDATPANLRATHLQRLEERLSSSGEDLREQCRFESDISTAPPKGLVALTFDDGPDPEHTATILAILDHYQVPASFFVIGEKVERHPDLLHAIRASGLHLVGSHTWTHPNFHDLPSAEQEMELARGIDVLLPDPSPLVFRYPYGNSSCFANDYLHSRGVAVVGWHVDSCDWAFDRTGTVDPKEALSCGVGSEYRGDFVGHIASSVRARRGGIILLHEIHAITPARLGELIEEIRRDGFTFVRLDDPRFGPSLR